MPDVVVQVVQHLRPGGLEMVALDLVRQAPRGVEAHLVSLEGDAAHAVAAWPRLRELGHRLHMLGKPPGVAPLLVPRLARLLRRLGASAVETHHIGPLLYGGLAARLAGVRRLVHVEHDAWHLDVPAAARLHRMLVLLLQPRLVAVGTAVAVSLERRLGKVPVGLIANGIDTARFRPGDGAAARRRLGLPEGAVLIGCAARLEPVKGHADLLAATARLPDDVHLALAGDGSLAEALRADAQRLGIGGRVHFLGAVADMPQFYQALDRFCLASHAEGLPLAPLEAQASGVAVVVTDVGGAPEAVCPTTGRLVPARDPEALATALGASLATPGSADPRAFVVDRHDLHRVAAAHYRLLAA